MNTNKYTVSEHGGRVFTLATLTSAIAFAKELVNATHAPVAATTIREVSGPCSRYVGGFLRVDSEVEWVV